MKRACFFISFIAFCSCIHVIAESEPPAVHYGQATVGTVLRIDEQCTLYCNIEGFPAIIGENMPVKINGFKPAPGSELNQKIKIFLCDLFLSENKKTNVVRLKNIARGDTFCLRADIEVNGNDLGDLLVENGLAKRVIEIKGTSSSQSQSNIAQDTEPARQTYQRKAYIASKTSKVYHRSTCPHAARMDQTKAVYFSTKAEAEKTGRRPCKTCNP